MNEVNQIRKKKLKLKIKEILNLNFENKNI